MHRLAELKRSRLVWSALLLAAIGLSVFAFSLRQKRSATQRELEAAYDRLDLALRQNDLSALMAGWTPDYTELRLNAKLWDRAQAEMRYRQAMTEWKRFSEQTNDLFRVTVQGDSALVVVHRKRAGQYLDTRGVYGAAGALHQLEVSTLDADQWVRTAQGWKMRSRCITSANIKVDGRSFTKADVPAGASTDSEHDE